MIARARTFFATSKTSQGRCLLQSQRSAELLIDVFRSYTLAGKLKVREFVVMPDHFHVLISLDGNTSIERAMQLIKGNYSFRRKKGAGIQRRKCGKGDFPRSVSRTKNYLARKQYIDENPVRAGLADSAENYSYCSAYLRKKKKASG
jgi:putative transposase